jgi:hypothetical protein
MAREQTYKTHRRYVPLYHFVALPVLWLNVIAQVMYFVKYSTLYKAWMIAVSLALALLAWYTRAMAARVQDRVIRLEERMRLLSVLPAELSHRVHEIRPRQLVALRFASDEELPELVQRIYNGELTRGEEIKRAIRSWRADHLRM